MSANRPRAREAGILLGRLAPGGENSITDVPGVRVGHTTLHRGENVHTGVTAVLPHQGNLLQRPVPGAVFWTNAFGKLVGSPQVEELGEIETPILLTSTLNVPRAADALIEYLLGLPGNGSVESVNPLVAETNDRWLNDVRMRPVGPAEVAHAIESASSSLPAEGAVGAGTGTMAFGYKGGIGTSSRRVPLGEGTGTVGVLVQTNYGGRLTISGAPVGEELRRAGSTPTPGTTGGSVIVVLATDAPLDARNLRRLAVRAMLGIGRTGSDGSNRSGDYAIAFSTDLQTARLSNDLLDPLFAAGIEATEEAVYNSLFRAETTTGRGRRVEALPIEPTLEILRRYHRLEGS